MLPGIKNIAINKKATFSQEFQVLNGTPSKANPTAADIAADITSGALVPQNLTSSVISAKIAPKAGATPIISFTTGITDAVHGKFRISLTAAQTAALNYSEAVYDVRIDLGGTGTNVVTYMTGQANLVKAVS